MPRDNGGISGRGCAKPSLDGLAPSPKRGQQLETRWPADGAPAKRSSLPIPFRTESPTRHTAAMNWRERAKQPQAQTAGDVIALSVVLIAALVAWSLGSRSWAQFFASAVVAVC